jgi:Arabinose-binding domain of AraC transcription regulator, N-term
MKMLLFSTQGKPEPQLVNPKAIEKKWYPVSDNKRQKPCPDNRRRSFEPCEGSKAGLVAQLQAARQVFRFALHSEQRKGAADRWIERACLRIDQTCRAIRHTRRPGLPSRRNTEQHQLVRRGAFSEIKDFARGIDDASRNAIRLSSDPHLPYRIGKSIHISTYGMYGFAILCCPDFRKAMTFAELYHALAAPLATIEFSEEDGFARWVIEPNARAATDPQVYRFITEMQIGIHISLMRDIMGPAFTPDEINLAYPESRDFGLPADQIGCRLGFAGTANQIIFRSAWLDQAAHLGNKTTYPAVVALCDDLLKDLKSRIGLCASWSAVD